jgi:hypothetical protein
VTPYIRYEIDWCYTYSKDFGEETRFCALNAASENLRTDFYVVDDAVLVHIEYGSGGVWKGFSRENEASYATALITGSSAVWDAATKLEEFLADYRNRSV